MAKPNPSFPLNQDALFFKRNWELALDSHAEASQALDECRTELKTAKETYIHRFPCVAFWGFMASLGLVILLTWLIYGLLDEKKRCMELIEKMNRNFKNRLDG